MAENITGILLAGGKSSRFGSDKALTIFNGKPLINFGLDLLKQICSDILISSNSEHMAQFGYRVVPDEIKDIGPMGGVYSCLKQSKSSQNLVISCDTPFINKGLLQYLLDHNQNFQAVIPETEDGHMEPLIACYHSEVQWVMKDLIGAGKYKMQNIMDQVPTLKLPIRDNLDFYHNRLFFNINYPTDLDKINSDN